MSDVAALIADMVRAGIDPDMIGRTAAAFAERAVDVQAERRRARDRERKALLPNDWPELRQFILSRDGEVCAYCADEEGPFHIDHIFPSSRGGSSDPDNLCVACATCNVSKKDKTPEEWRASWV